MMDQNAKPRSAQPQGDARDILARLYREIGISAVAAALQPTAAKPKNPEQEEARRQWRRRFDGYAA